MLKSKENTKMHQTQTHQEFKLKGDFLFVNKLCFPNVTL